MEFTLTLALPRAHLSVLVARRVLRSTMGALGVLPDVVADIELALAEACTNVLTHAPECDEYEVSVGIDATACVIDVVDRGGGYDGSAAGLADAAPSAEHGRGIQLMRALVDQVTFVNRPMVGTVVHLRKELAWQRDAPVRRLTEGRAATRHGLWSEDERSADAPELV